MTKQHVFKSTMASTSVRDHVFEAFGYEAAQTAYITYNTWGVMVEITTGDNQGCYDVHYNGPNAGLTFIDAG